MFDSKKKTKAAPQLPVLRPRAAGGDVSSRDIWIAVPSDCDEQPVRRFSNFTHDLKNAIAWLTACGITTIAMESTGVYWIPMFQMLEDAGIEACLVNAKHVKNVPGRKSDVQDCQWLQFLHAVGLLRGSYRPNQEICAIRSLERHRGTLVAMAASHVQHMQKCLDQMNLQLHHVLSDITGKTGLAILDAILSGDRDPLRLSLLRDRRIQASPETIAGSLEGDYRLEHVFVLRQSLAIWRQYQQQILKVEEQIRSLHRKLEGASPLSQTNPEPPAAGPRKRGRPRGSHSQETRNQNELHRIFGVDLVAVPGLNVLTARSLLAEVGSDFAGFPNAPAFCSWLSVCPGNSVSGGKTLSSRTKQSKNRLAKSLRLAAQSLQFSHSALGDWYRRTKGKLGPAQANTAGAHKLARIIYRMVTTTVEYSDALLEQQNRNHIQRRETYIRKQAQALGYQLIPAPLEA